MNLSIRHHFSLDRLVVASITFALTWGSMASASAAATPYQLPLLGVSPVAPNVIFTLGMGVSVISWIRHSGGFLGAAVLPSKLNVPGNLFTYWLPPAHVSAWAHKGV